MRCYSVLVHGKLNWQVEPTVGVSDEAVKPTGFYCHRYVLASSERKAVEEAFKRVRMNLDTQTSWFRDGTAVVDLEAEEVSSAPMYKLLKPENRGHTFYDGDYVSLR